MEGLGHLFFSLRHPDSGFFRCLCDSERAGWPGGPVRANLDQYWHGLDGLLCCPVALEDALASIHAPFRSVNRREGPLADRGVARYRVQKGITSLAMLKRNVVE